MADERWYVHNDDIYGVSIDHDPEFGSGRSDPYYEWCDITDIDELKKQKPDEDKKKKERERDRNNQNRNRR